MFHPRLVGGADAKGQRSINCALTLDPYDIVHGFSQDRPAGIQAVTCSEPDRSKDVIGIELPLEAHRCLGQRRARGIVENARSHRAQAGPRPMARRGTAALKGDAGDSMGYGQLSGCDRWCGL